MRITHTQQQSRTLQAGFTLVELLVIVAVIGIVSGIGLTTMASFLQEQRLRQAAFELASYLQSARARAQRDGKICRVEIDGTSTIKPSNSSDNGCTQLPELNLQAVSGASGLTTDSSSAGTMTFTPAGTLAFPNPFYSPMIYLRYSGASSTKVQRCLYLDLVSIRIGWRNGEQGACIYTRG